MENKVVMEARHVSKTFPGVVALNHVDLSFRPGEVHALIGENGAGKSTLMNILSGVYQPDEGAEILFQGKKIVLNSPREASACGIAMIHQENSLVQNLTVYENIFLGHFATKGGFVDKESMIKVTRGLLERLNISNIDAGAMVKYLSSSEKQLIEIAKAISLNPRIIIMDEPTASLTVKETGTLMGIIRQLKAEGAAILFISHHLEELFEIADVISVLRDGEYIGTYRTAEMTMDKLVSMMVGRELRQGVGEKSREEINRRKKSLEAPVVLEAEGLSYPGKVENAGFQLHKGEILGFAGLVGAGRSELMELIYGYRQPSRGVIKLHGKEVRFASPGEALRAGIGMLTEDRKVTGILRLHSVRDNINVAVWPKLKKGFFLQADKEQRNAEKYIEEINIKTPSQDVKISTLSGGNQQKALLGRMLSDSPQILILDEPTHGIDVGAKDEIYGIINRLAGQGVSILLVSSELPELISLSHRLIVMHEGKINGTLEYEEFNQVAILNYASNISC